METMVKKQPVEPVIPVIEVDALPNDWALKTIGEICEKVEKIDPAAAPNAEIQYIDIGGINNKLLRIVDAKTYLGKDAPSRARQLVKANDVVISTVRTYLKNIALVPDELDGQVASTGFCVLRAADPWMGRYLYYFVQSEAVLKEIGKQQRGTSYPAVRDSDIKAQFVPVPPKKDAKRIVSAIELQLGRLDAAVARLHAAKAKLKRYKQAVLKAAYDQFEKRPLEELATVITKGASPSWQGVKYVNDPGQTLFVTSENVREGFLDLSEPKYVENSFNQLQKRSVLKNGDVLLNIVGASIGRAAIYDRYDLANTNQAVCLIRTTRELDNGFLCNYLNSEEAKTYYSRNQVDVARANLSLKDVRELPVPYVPVKEQRTFSQKIDKDLAAANEMETTLEAQLAQAVRLRQSVLKRAFEGRLV